MADIDENSSNRRAPERGSGLSAMLKLETAYAFLLFWEWSPFAAVVVALTGVLLTQIAEDCLPSEAKKFSRSRHMLAWGLLNICVAIAVSGILLWPSVMNSDWPKLLAAGFLLALYSGAVVGGRMLGIVVDRLFVPHE